MSDYVLVMLWSFTLSISLHI